MWGSNIYWLLPISALTRGWTLNMGMCPDQESNPQNSGVQDDTVTNELCGQDHIEFLKSENGTEKSKFFIFPWNT